MQKVAEESLKKTIELIQTGGTYESEWGNVRLRKKLLKESDRAKAKSNLKKYPVQFEQFIKVMIKHHTKYIDLNNFRDKLVLKVDPKIPRNQSCPCGSGKKYKKCCGRNA